MPANPAQTSWMMLNIKMVLFGKSFKICSFSELVSFCVGIVKTIGGGWVLFWGGTDIFILFSFDVVNNCDSFWTLSNIWSQLRVCLQFFPISYELSKVSQHWLLLMLLSNVWVTEAARKLVHNALNHTENFT